MGCILLGGFGRSFDVSRGRRELGLLRIGVVKRRPAAGGWRWSGLSIGFAGLNESPL